MRLQVCANRLLSARGRPPPGPSLAPARRRSSPPSLPQSPPRPRAHPLVNPRSRSRRLPRPPARSARTHFFLFYCACRYEQALGQKLFSSKNELEQKFVQELAAAEHKLSDSEKKLVSAENKWINARGESEKAHYFRGMHTAQTGVDTAQKVVDYYVKKLCGLDSDYNQVL